MLVVGASVRPLPRAKGSSGLDPDQIYTIIELKQEPIIPSIKGTLYTFVRLEGVGGWFISSLFALAQNKNPSV